ncbi:U6 snRNA-associated Sm-like protein LSm2 [Paramacrobiotus metropolitanus]|uniref:U6 snRNA-associated Sm-like protein LSm2 n=1 Tax=Paramacrobiotus metropolitanus TaxID=2943436 RepID=UPI002445B023|nr:U6 snRNA-associated Sm-like protein LSm2 [Paramacrobiotus metropolitanus]
MLFYSFFKSLIGKKIVVELKNDMSLGGTLDSVDQYLNMKLMDVAVTDPAKFPHMLAVKNIFIRGSVIRYVHLPAEEVDVELLQDASRRDAQQAKTQAKTQSSTKPQPQQRSAVPSTGGGANVVG